MPQHAPALLLAGYPISPCLAGIDMARKLALVGDAKVRESAELVAPVLGWNNNDTGREVETYRAYVRKYHMIDDTDWSA